MISRVVPVIKHSVREFNPSFNTSLISILNFSNEGFHLYLTTAEPERLAILHPPERICDLFEKHLPYALALDTEKSWTEQFNEIISRAMENGHYSPAWYSGSLAGSAFNTVVLSSSLA